MIDLHTTTRTFLTVEEAAAILNKSRRAIYYWIESGKIDTVYAPMGQRIPIAEVRRIFAYLREGCKGRTSPSTPSTTSATTNTTSVQHSAKSA